MTRPTTTPPPAAPTSPAGIYPVVVSITAAEGAVRHLDEEIGVVVRDVVAARTENPGA